MPREGTVAHLIEVGSSLAHPLVTPVVRIGRDPESDILVRDATVSRHHAEIRLAFGVRTDDRIAVLSCPIPDFFIARLLEADIAYMDQASKQRRQAKRKPWRQILVEKQAQTRLARRPASAANW